MLTTLWGILGFIITISLLVFIHEYGHFMVARFFGVKIIRFSIGFGKPIIAWTGKKEGTQYTIAPIPLGGFVQMYGENNKDNQTLDEAKAFMHKPAWQRFLIAFAGPAVNLIFAILIFSSLYVYGVKGLRPEIVEIAPHSLADVAGLQKGDLIQSINQQQIKLSQEAIIALLNGTQKRVTVDFERNNTTMTGVLDLRALKRGDELDINAATGLYLAGQWWPQAAIIERVIAESPAQHMGLQAGDIILAINQQHFIGDNAAREISKYIASLKNLDTLIEIDVMRGNKAITVEGHLGHLERNHQQIGYLGVAWQGVSAAYFEKYITEERYSPFTALTKGSQQTWNYVRLTFNTFAKMIMGKASIDNIGGPITIGDVAGRTIQISFEAFLNFLAVISLSLAVINLLPIPMLDGGHMLFSAIEILIRRPVSEALIKRAYQIGAVIVIGFMCLVIVKDIWRYVL